MSAYTSAALAAIAQAGEQVDKTRALAILADCAIKQLELLDDCPELTARFRRLHTDLTKETA